MKNIALILLAFCCLNAGLYAQSDHLHRTMIVLCMQEEFTCNDAFIPGKFSDPVLLNINLLTEHLKTQKIPVLYTQLEGAAPFERTGVKVPDLDLNLLIDGERRFVQKQNNALENQLLLDDLLEQDLRVLYVAGIMTNEQVYGTVVAALKRNFRVYVLEDATAAHTDKLQKKFIKKMRRKGAEIISSQELLDRQF